MKKLELSQVDSDAILRGDGFVASKMSLRSPSNEMAHYMRLRPKPFKNRKLVNLMLGDIPFPIYIDSIAITNETIVYRHRHQDHDVPEVLRFDNLCATLEHVSNTGSHPMVMHIETRGMGKGRLTVGARIAANERIRRPIEQR